jgi:uncharacterized repeat protein (TIGR01451 family)/MYXO-CTERM domain-containing protein
MSRFLSALLATAFCIAPSVAYGQITLPLTEGFEGTAGAVYRVNTTSIAGAPDWAFETNAPNDGRLRMAAGTGYYSAGSAAATLDRDPSGTVVINYLIGTFDLSAYDATVAPAVLLSFDVMDHGEEASDNDRVWVRGTNADAWLEIADLTTPNLPNGTYSSFDFIDLSAALVAGSQNFSATTQIRFGQEDNFPSTSITASDGLTFDEIKLELSGPNATALAVTAPTTGLCGDAAQMITVQVGAGNEAISAVPVQIDVTGAITATFNETIAGIPIEGVETITVGPIDTTVGGTIDITVTTTLAGDISPGDDVLVEAGLEFVGLTIPVAVAPVACPTYGVELSVVPEGGESYLWYDDAAGTNSVGSGDTYSTPAIPTGGASYWVGRVEQTVDVGPASNAAVGTSGGNYVYVQEGVAFDVFDKTVTIESITVYPEGAGDVVINIEDSSGTLVDTETVAVTPSTAGEETVLVVDLEVPPGSGYTMDALGTTTGGLYRNTSGAVYPYTSTLLHITGALNGIATYYYFFYDIQGAADACPGGLTEVAVTSDVSECQADLSVSLVEPTAPLTAGSPYDWTIDIVNNGPHDATGISLDVVPDAAGSFVMNAGDCTVPFACALINMAPGATVQVVTSWALDADFDIDFAFEQTFSVTATESDPASGDESATSSAAVERRVDLVLGITTDPDPPVAGALVTYVVEITNNGPSEATEVSVELTLPELWVVAESLGCVEDPGGGAPCTVGTLAALGTTILEFDVQVPADQQDAFSATAAVTSADTETTPGDETATIESTPVQSADLSVTVEDDPDPVRAGDSLTYTVTVANDGPSDAAGVSLQLTAPDRFTADPVEGCDATLLCVIGDLIAAGEVSFEVGGTVAGKEIPVLMEFSAVVTSKSTDPDEANNTASEDTAVLVVADLSLTGEIEPTEPIATVDDVTITLTAANAGPSPVRDAVVDITLPAGVEAPELGDCTQAADVVTCPLASLAVDGTQDLVVVLSLTADAEGAITITAEISFSGEETVAGDETVVLEINVQPAPDVGDDDDDDDDDQVGCTCESSVADGGSSWALLGLLALGLRRRRS